MKTGRIVLSLIVLSMLWCADVFAHDDGGPVAHFCPGSDKDPCKGTGCDPEHDDNPKNDRDYDGGHGHINEFYSKDDLNRKPITMKEYDPNLHNATSWGY